MRKKVKLKVQAPDAGTGEKKKKKGGAKCSAQKPRLSKKNNQKNKLGWCGRAQKKMYTFVDVY